MHYYVSMMTIDDASSDYDDHDYSATSPATTHHTVDISALAYNETKRFHMR